MPQIQWTMSTIRNIILIMCLSLTIYFAFRLRSATSKLTDVEQINSNLKETLITKRTAEGLFVAKIGVLESYNQETFTRLATQDSTIKKLQNLVVQYKKELKKKGSATVIETHATADIVVPTQGDTSGVSPIYNSTFNLKGWVWGSTRASSDSTKVSLQFREEIDVVIGEESTGFWGLGKKKPFVEVTLNNPYNEVKSLRSYATKVSKEKRFYVGPVVAYGVNNLLSPELFVGFGVGYGLIRF